MTFLGYHCCWSFFQICSENHLGRQGILRSGRHTAVRQVQVIEVLHEGVRSHIRLSRWRLQPVVTQVLPALQLHGLRHVEGTPAVHPFQQSAML